MLFLWTVMLRPLYQASSLGGNSMESLTPVSVFLCLLHPPNTEAACNRTVLSAVRRMIARNGPPRTNNIRGSGIKPPAHRLVTLKDVNFKAYYANSFVPSRCSSRVFIVGWRPQNISRSE